MSSTIDIHDGSQQINPAATTVIQKNYFFGDIYAENFLNEHARESRQSVQMGVIEDMCLRSATLPAPVINEIRCKTQLDFYERRLSEKGILCLSGEQGVGLTTMAAQFVRSHSQNCASYFINGLERVSMQQSVFESNLIAQLHWYVYHDQCGHVPAVSDMTLEVLYTPLVQRLKRENRKMLFVIDGLRHVPAELSDGIRRVLEKLPWSHSQVLFTGNANTVRGFLHENLHKHISEHEMMGFSEEEVNSYFLKANPNLTPEQLGVLYDITRGNARRMEKLRSSYIDKDRIDELFTSDITSATDLFGEDLEKILYATDPLTEDVFTLLTFNEFPLCKSLVMEILEMNGVQLDPILDAYKEFLKVDENEVISFRSEGFHRYLRGMLTKRKRDIELRTIRVLESKSDVSTYSSYIPAIYKSVGDFNGLLQYLNSDNVQHIMIEKKSQSALNEQCEFGFEACRNNVEKYKSQFLRFAVNRTTSREIEHNKMWNDEIEALIAIDESKMAIALAQSIYLEEERLKAFLLIAKNRKYISEQDYAVVKENIDTLVQSIDFEHIPDKALELAKLLLPVNYEAAISIADRLAKNASDTAKADRMYTILSLIQRSDGEVDDFSKADIANTKIQDDGLRQLARSAKHLFSDASVEVFLEELSRLPKNSHKLRLLQIWLPEHRNKPNIGKAVLEAVKLIVAESDTEMPKARVLYDVCRSMDKMSREEADSAMSVIESLGDSIKYPTLDYVDAEIRVIESIRETLPEKSLAHLENLYLYITELADDSVRITCLAKLLGRFDYLGQDRREVARTIGDTTELRTAIVSGVKKLYDDTAFHIQVVQGPIKALVCGYTSMVDELVADINTSERISRAYGLAAYYYLLQEESAKLDLNKFFRLLSKCDYSVNDRLPSLRLLCSDLVYADNMPHERLLPVIKANFRFFETLENDSRGPFLMRLYLWIHKHFPDDKYVAYIKKLLYDSWEAIGVDWQKIEAGLYIAKYTSRISKEDAKSMIDRCRQLQSHNIFSSNSCFSAFYTGLDLYVRSFCYLVRTGCCSDDQLRYFADDMENVLSEVERSDIWTKVALAYYVNKDEGKFHDVCDKYLPSDIRKFDRYLQRDILYSCSPALFIRNQENFFTCLSDFDEPFQNACIRNVIEFIVGRQPFTEDITLHSDKDYNLHFRDYNYLVTLLRHSSDDSIFFHTINLMSHNLRTTNPQKPLSSEQKRVIATEAQKVVESKLPTANGIRHDGYKISCLAALEYISGDFQRNKKQYWKEQIESIGNKADRSFLYLIIAPYFQSKMDKEEFFKIGMGLAQEINSTYDKTNRFDLCINQCIDNNLRHLIPPVVDSTRKGLGKDGRLEDYKRIIDAIYQYEPKLAENIADSFDNDPARMHYRKRLHNHIDKVKRLEEAKKDVDSTKNLSNDELERFYDNQLAMLLEDKGQAIELNKLFPLVADFVYSTDMSTAKSAIIYLMESIYRRHLISKNQTELMLNLFTTLRHNLKLIISLNAGTKEKVGRVETIINTSALPSSPGFIGIGEDGKAIEYILSWYQKYSTDSLVVIDPYFSPDDLHLIKHICDINNNVSINILCHGHKVALDDYKSRWCSITDGVTNNVTIHLVRYEGKNNDGPLHDRYWICNDPDSDEIHGIKPPSVNSLGSKESSICEADEKTTISAINSFNIYAYNKPRKRKEQHLEYDEIKLS